MQGTTLDSYYRMQCWFDSGKGGISATVWDRFQPSIVRNLGNYWLVAIIPVQEPTPKLTVQSFTPVCEQVDVSPVVSCHSLALRGVLHPELYMKNVHNIINEGYLLYI